MNTVMFWWRTERVWNVNKAEIHLYICKSSKTPWQEKLEIENELKTNGRKYHHFLTICLLISPFLNNMLANIIIYNPFPFIAIDTKTIIVIIKETIETSQRISEPYVYIIPTFPQNSVLFCIWNNKTLESTIEVWKYKSFDGPRFWIHILFDFQIS